METAKLGPLAFYKVLGGRAAGGWAAGPPGSSHLLCRPPQGLVPAGIRLMPHTVLTFVFLEQLRKHFGIRAAS